VTSHDVTLENGVWKPWRHADYREPPTGLQGWWRHVQTGEVIAVLSLNESPEAGRIRVQAARYDGSQVRRGSGIQLLVETLKRDYVREPDNLDPRSTT
jgi:hypothetical protein